MTAPTPRVPAAHESAITKLLNGIGSALNDPNNAGLLGLASGLGAASAPHMLTPVSMGQALSMGMQGAQQYRQQALANAIQQQAMLPYQVARTHEAQQAVSGQNNPNLSPLARAGDQALAANIISPGMGATLYGNNPAVVAQKTLAETLNQLQKIPANERAVLLAKAFNLPAQGALPEATQQTPGGGVAPMAGAPGSIAANAANKAGGAASAAYPYSAALSYHTKTPGQAGGTLGPRPAPFAPVGAALPQAAPGASSAAREAAIREQIGLMNGVSGAANAAGRPAPFAPPTPALPSGGYPQPTPGGLAPPGTLAAERAAAQRQLPAVVGELKAAQGAGAVPVPGAALPGARGAQPQPEAGGIFSPGSTVAGYELQKAAAQQTLAQEGEAAKETEAAQAQLARLTEMQQALDRIPVGGNFSKVYEGIGNALNYAGIKVPGLAAIQEYSKYRTNFVADAARKMGAKVSYQEVGYIAKGVPDFTLAGNAPRALLAQLSGAAQYDIARNQAMTYYANHVPNLYGKAYQGTARGFETWWQKSGVTPGSFMFMSTAWALPPAQRAEYLRNFQRNQTGKAYIKQYQKAQAFLRQHPQLVPFWQQQ
jgi:hypothetical protein